MAFMISAGRHGRLASPIAARASADSVTDFCAREKSPPPLRAFDLS
jgi:hypothetical protein